MADEVTATPTTSAASPRRRLGGLRARDSGAAFEVWLSYVFRQLVARGVLARFDKMDAPTRAIKDSVRGAVFVPIGAGGADWILLAPGGKYVAIEAKSTADVRLYRDEVLPHQAVHLDSAIAAGAGAFLAVQFRQPTPIAFLVPWQSVPWTSARTAKSVTAADLAPWKVASWIDAARILGASRAT